MPEGDAARRRAVVQLGPVHWRSRAALAVHDGEMRDWLAGGHAEPEELERFLPRVSDGRYRTRRDLLDAEADLLDPGHRERRAAASAAVGIDERRFGGQGAAIFLAWRNRPASDRRDWPQFRDAWLAEGDPEPPNPIRIDHLLWRGRMEHRRAILERTAGAAARTETR